jgi:hypothetical protein
MSRVVSHAQRLERLQRQLADQPVLTIVPADWLLEMLPEATRTKILRAEQRLTRRLSIAEWGDIVAESPRRASSADGEAREPRADASVAGRS